VSGPRKAGRKEGRREGKKEGKEILYLSKYNLKDITFRIQLYCTVQ
jgi:hypothetical protein